MATYSFTTAESQSQTIDTTVTITGMAAGGATGASSNTGNAAIQSQSGTSVTVRCTGGTSTRSSSGSTPVADSTTRSCTVSTTWSWDGTGWNEYSTTNNAPSSVPATQGTGTLYKDSVSPSTSSKPGFNGTTFDQRQTTNATGTAYYSGTATVSTTVYYYQYNVTVTYTPVKTTYGTIELVSANENVINVRIKDLEYASGYTQLVIQGPSGTIGVSIAGNNGVSSYTSSASFTGLTPSTSYSFTAKFTYPNESQGQSGANYSTTAHVDAAPTLNFSNIAVSNGGITCTFSGYDQDGLRASNTYGLQISTADTLSYGSQVFYSNSTQNTNFTYTFTVDGAGLDFVNGKQYTVRIILYDAINQQTQDVKQLVFANTLPTLNFSAIDGFNAVTCTFSGYDPEGLKAANTYSLQISGPDDTSYGAIVYYTDARNNVSFTYTFTKDSTNTTFVVGKTYTVRIIIYDKNGGSATATKSVKYSKSRPANFAWTNAKSTGAPYNLTATEWGALLDKVNEFRQYKGLGNVVFTRTINGSGSYVIPTANHFNAVRTAILALTPPTSPPNSASQKMNVTAYHYNQMRDSLNSTT